MSPFNLPAFLGLSGLDVHSDHFLFRPIIISVGASKLIKKKLETQLYSGQSNYREKKGKKVSPQLNLGLHSLRLEDDSTAAKSDVNQKCIKKHESW